MHISRSSFLQSLTRLLQPLLLPGPLCMPVLTPETVPGLLPVPSGRGGLVGRGFRESAGVGIGVDGSANGVFLWPPPLCVPVHILEPVPSQLPVSSVGGDLVGGIFREAVGVHGTITQGPDLILPALTTVARALVRTVSSSLA